VLDTSTNDLNPFRKGTGCRRNIGGSQRNISGTSRNAKGMLRKRSDRWRNTGGWQRMTTGWWCNGSGRFESGVFRMKRAKAGQSGFQFCALEITTAINSIMIVANTICSL